MNFGQTIPPGAEILGPWMPRGADNGIYTFEIIAFDSPITPSEVDVDILHKNSDDTGRGQAASGTFAEITSGSGILEAQFNGLKELVRCRIKNNTTTSALLVWRSLGWVWFNTPNASS